MDKLNLKNVLTAVRDMIMRNRVAYKDYLGSETVTKTDIIVEGILVEEGTLTLKDSSVTSFVIGESYDVTIDGVTEVMIAYDLSENSTGYGAPATNYNIIALGNVTDLSNLPSDGWVVAIHDGTAACKTLGSYIGKSISISQTKTITEKHYDIKKLPDELLPNTVAKKTDVTAVKKLATNAQTLAETAQTAADNAQTAADNAQTAADNAQTAADNAVKYTTSQDLTDAQKQQARTNIGAGTSSFSGSYNDLTNKPTAVQSDWEVNNDSDVAYIKNRTHYERTEYSAIFFNNSPIASSPINDIYYYGEKTGSSLSIGEGNIYKVHGSDGNTYISTCQRVPIPGLAIGLAGYVLGNARLGVDAGYLNGTHSNYPITDTGEPWCFISYNNTARNAIISTISDFRISSIYVQTAHELKQLDEKYIPSTIQRVGDDLILLSSTADSTKKFKITVDDSGAISATEVT